MSSASQAATSGLDTGLADAPAVYRMPALRPTLPQAQAWCQRLAESHYENFHVATFFLPRRLRPHFHSVYAFCRTSDDLGDEVGDTKIATQLLAEWRGMLHGCFAELAEPAPLRQARHPVYVALEPTITACDLPREPFDDLITAFEQDQVYPHHASLATLEAYSRYSANPVGRLVLLLCGYRDAERLGLSDEICTALQLANFYQDVVTDWVDRGRRYLPADAMARFGVTDSQIAERRFDANFRELMRFLVEDARARLHRGQRLVGMVDPELAATLSLFVKGGLAILRAIERQDFNTLGSRPVVTRTAKLGLLAEALTGRLRAVMPFRRRVRPGAELAAR